MRKFARVAWRCSGIFHFASSRSDVHSARPTIRDVAAQAGVSVSSVSRVMNGGRYTSPELHARIMRAVNRLALRAPFGGAGAALTGKQDDRLHGRRSLQSALQRHGQRRRGGISARRIRADAGRDPARAGPRNRVHLGGAAAPDGWLAAVRRRQCPYVFHGALAPCWTCPAWRSIATCLTCPLGSRGSSRRRSRDHALSDRPRPSPHRAAHRPRRAAAEFGAARWLPAGPSRPAEESIPS